MSMVAADMGRQQPLHPLAQVAVVMGPQDQVEMIRHPTIAEYAHRQALAGVADQLDKRPIVAVLVEDGGPAVAAVNNVVTIASARGTSGAVA
jgi:hypothetical protein